ncbi:MAG: M1 family peptidase, partial [Ginsengibacter sp.]
YGTDACDISLDSVKAFKADPTAAARVQGDTTIQQSLAKPMVTAFDDVSKQRNREDKNIVFATDADTALRDFYWKYDRGIEPYDSTKYAVNVGGFTEQADAESKAKASEKYFYELTLSNKGGLVMPIILEWDYKDGTKEVERIPAQVWRLNEQKVVKTFMKDKEVASIKLDPMRETADINESNNTWNTMPPPSHFALYKQKQQARGATTTTTPMQKAEEKKKGF